MLCDGLLNDRRMSHDEVVRCIRAVGVCVSVNGEFHPNLYILVQHMKASLGHIDATELDNLEMFLDELAVVSVDEYQLLVRLCVLGCIADGSLDSEDAELLWAVGTVARRDPAAWFFQLTSVRKFARDFQEGRADLLQLQRLLNLFSNSQTSQDDRLTKRARAHVRDFFIWLCSC
eukprot:TRINITY_DN9690_c0_g2_i1.p1 TRINITY_DN9690_c0_g2~~TRINITY_DN9690_c0_g2_i1.p1  ORF type:complete len:175 (+),score=34.68 TRINITY_DN9690_c0_g2_i1:3-527(+)